MGRGSGSRLPQRASSSLHSHSAASLRAVERKINRKYYKMMRPQNHCGSIPVPKSLRLPTWAAVRVVNTAVREAVREACILLYSKLNEKISCYCRISSPSFASRAGVKTRLSGITKRPHLPHSPSDQAPSISTGTASLNMRAQFSFEKQVLRI